MARDYDEGPRRRRSWDDDEYDEAPAGHYGDNLPHSGVGIASFILGLGSVGLFAVLMIVAIVQANRPRYYREQAMDTLLGLLSCGMGLMALVGTGLGIGGVCQANRRKVFGIIGLCLNGVLLLGIIALFLIGFVIGMALFARH